MNRNPYLAIPLGPAHPPEITRLGAPPGLPPAVADQWPRLTPVDLAMAWTFLVPRRPWSIHRSAIAFETGEPLTVLSIVPPNAPGLICWDEAKPKPMPMCFVFRLAQLGRLDGPEPEPVRQELN